MKKINNKLEKLIYKKNQELLVDQLINALEIDLFKYIRENKYEINDFHFNKTDYGYYYGIDINVYDEVDENEIYHLHPEDMIWLILHYNEALKNIQKNIDEYFLSKKNN